MPAADLTAIHSAALDYRRLGWSVIPIGNDKEPLKGVRWSEFRHCLASLAEIDNWFRPTSPATGLAVIGGLVSNGLCIRDFDCLDAFNCWAAAYPHEAATLPTVATARGRHVYGRLTPDELHRVREATSTLNARGRGAITFADGEFRGDIGAYWLVPPSLHPDGITYRWLNPPAGEIEFVEPGRIGWLCDWITGVTEQTEQAEQTDRQIHTEQSKQTETDRQTEHIEVNRADGAIDRAILSTLPTGPGQRNRYIFNLARQLKSIPGLTEADPKELERHVRDWHARALPVIRTKDFAETFSDFIGAWRKCEPSSADPLGRAIARARQISAGLPERAADLDGKKRLLALFCRELQRETGAAPFFLSTRTVARLFDVASPMLAGRMLKCLETLDFIRCVEKGKPGGKRASRFRWLHPLG